MTMRSVFNPLQRRSELDNDAVTVGGLYNSLDIVGSDGRYDHRAFKMVAIVSPRLDPTVAANTVGHMLVALGAQIGPWILGKQRTDADDQIHARLARFPFIMLAAKPAKIATLVSAARELLWITVVDYPEEGYTTTHDDDYGEALAARKALELTYIGTAMFGPTEAITQICGKLSLWRPRESSVNS
jgi:Protein of unknown function (DUF2000)